LNFSKPALIMHDFSGGGTYGFGTTPQYLDSITTVLRCDVKRQ